MGNTGIMQQNILNQVLNDIDQFNLNDPNKDFDELGDEHAKEFLYGKRMSNCLHEFMLNPPAELQIAARAQHIGRWLSLRSDYPEGRAGYLKWRTDLGKKHAELTAEIMRKHELAESFIDDTCSLLRKEKLKRNPLTQALEDVICLVFLKFYFVEFANKHQHEKIISIVQKTWGKMSPEGQQAALALDLSDEALSLVQQALA
ncbi:MULTISPECIES: DUF4202 domain-containing protein [unclassified Agarivorans]|uniref:DUF4202 domain-containing protein n=1 Tax=unclassified Agarivorans TaxID=2636026 RepID=UPI0026E3AD02|nr:MULTISPECIES: DUF4202 domain-containing protein [unclassified Agarivorans]MDO6687484.1 DUF4202 domain-containing protein [Agarivorans sp. 3_MG-2023]MDO6715250.1 DUF4202 domain-containing protein [Agarivorans sp. 2_MG-2023]MDO6763453.1 DUF4202 domain-containing protein [Agarivorans sp. 1_MG-2023]